MGTMLCQELNRRVLVLAPPHLIDEDNPGSWENAFRTFGFRARDYTCRSIGVIDRIISKNEHQDFDIVLIDEAHRFRSEETDTYAKLAQGLEGRQARDICRRCPCATRRRFPAWSSAYDRRRATPSRGRSRRVSGGSSH